MNKSINFRLNKFPSVPHVLRKIPLIDEAKTEFKIDLARLYHHYNMDKWGNAPIDPDPGNFDIFIAVTISDFLNQQFQPVVLLKEKYHSGSDKLSVGISSTNFVVLPTLPTWIKYLKGLFIPLLMG